MAAKTYHKTSFTLDHPTLELVDDFCEVHDLTRAQAIRRGLKIMLASEGIQTKPKAPRPQPQRVP